MKYMNISSKIFQRIMICLVSFLCLTNLTTSSFAKQVSNRATPPLTRNLEYSLGSIYYELVYPINNLTGTGDKLKDVPYKVQCKILECDTGCCVGEIDNMVCGVAQDCAVYLEKSKEAGLIIAIIVPVSLFIIFLILFITFKKVYNISTGKSMCYALGCLTIILIPLIAYLIYKRKENATSNPKQKDG